MTKTILYKLWFKIQLSTRAGARNPRPRVVTIPTRTSPGVVACLPRCGVGWGWGWGLVGGGRFRAVCMALVSNSSPDSKVPGANMGPTWVLSAPDGPHVGSMNLALRVHVQVGYVRTHWRTHGRSMFFVYRCCLCTKSTWRPSRKTAVQWCVCWRRVCVRVVMDRCSICVLPSSMTNCCHVTAVPAVTWPRRINLIHPMKWPWWSRKLATLQHIWLW